MDNMKTIVGLCRERKITFVIDDTLLYLYFNGTQIFTWYKVFRGATMIQYHNDQYELRFHLTRDGAPIVEIYRVIPRTATFSGWGINSNYKDWFYLQISDEEFEEIFYKV